MDFSSLMCGVLRVLRKFYMTEPMRIIPLLVDGMRAIRNAMDLTTLKEQTYWALWAFQWKGVMRGSDVLRPADDKERDSKSIGS